MLEKKKQHLLLLKENLGLPLTMFMGAQNFENKCYGGSQISCIHIHVCAICSKSL